MRIKLSTSHMTDASQPRESFEEAKSVSSLENLELEDRHFDNSLVAAQDQPSQLIDGPLLIAVFGEFFRELFADA